MSACGSCCLGLKGELRVVYESPETTHLRARCPAHVDKDVSESIVSELQYPCKLVVKAQDTRYVFMSDALNRAAKLYSHVTKGLQTLSEEVSALEAKHQHLANFGKDLCPIYINIHSTVVDSTFFPLHFASLTIAYVVHKLSRDLLKVKELMREHIQSQLKPAVEPLLSFAPERAHELMALQLDPRYCKGPCLLTSWAT